MYASLSRKHPLQHYFNFNPWQPACVEGNLVLAPSLIAQDLVEILVASNLAGKVPFAVPGPSGYFFTGFVTQWKGKDGAEHQRFALEEPDCQAFQMPCA